MEALDAIESLARTARQELPPATHVQINTTALQALQRQQNSLSPLAWSAGVSLIAACIVIFMSLHTTSTTTDSVTALFAPAQMEMP